MFRRSGDYNFNIVRTLTTLYVCARRTSMEYNARAPPRHVRAVRQCAHCSATCAGLRLHIAIALQFLGSTSSCPGSGSSSGPGSRAGAGTGSGVGVGSRLTGATAKRSGPSSAIGMGTGIGSGVGWGSRLHIIIARQLRETSWTKIRHMLLWVDTNFRHTSTVSVSFANTTDTPLGTRILEMTESTEDEWSPSVDDRGTKDERLEIKLLALSQIYESCQLSFSAFL